ncbi:MAG: RNA pseudouridine synthase [Oscillospiraceae bacterium]|nr:RNA pseudouridine synthase [Oscillospiraceae bacterium]
MEILYHDKKIVVCIKPVGLDSEHEMCKELQEALGVPVFPVHRLDKNVGGVMLYACTKDAAARCSRLVQEGLLVKEYVALVHGEPPEAGDWEDLLFKDSRKNKVFVVKRQRAGVKAARLAYRRLSQAVPCPVRIRLYTGRSHQIRVQFASRGFPLLGDHKYGAKDENTAPMLYSCCLSFPWNGENLRFEKLPEWLFPV